MSKWVDYFLCPLMKHCQKGCFHLSWAVWKQKRNSRQIKERLLLLAARFQYCRVWWSFSLKNCKSKFCNGKRDPWGIWSKEGAPYLEATLTATLLRPVFITQLSLITQSIKAAEARKLSPWGMNTFLGLCWGAEILLRWWLFYCCSVEFTQIL